MLVYKRGDGNIRLSIVRKIETVVIASEAKQSIHKAFVQFVDRRGGQGRLAMTNYAPPHELK
jgi:hypothetical protein